MYNTSEMLRFSIVTSENNGYDHKMSRLTHEEQRGWDGLESKHER